MSLSELVTRAVDIWVLIFATSIITSFVVVAIQMIRQKDLWDTPAWPVLLVLYAAWAVPLIAPILLFWLLFAASKWLCRHLVFYNTTSH
jgi:hypothetical protein